MSDWINALLAASPWILGIIGGWVAGNAVLKKALTLTINTTDDVFDMVDNMHAGWKDLMVALEDKNVTEEEYAKLAKDYDTFMESEKKFEEDGKATIAAYRELFGVIINVFRKK